MFQNVNRVPFSSRSRLFQFQQNENKKMTQWWIDTFWFFFYPPVYTKSYNNPSCLHKNRRWYHFFYSVYTHKICLLFKDRCVVRLRKDKTPNLMYHIRSETLFISMFWWWTLAINWMTYDQYIYILRCKCQQSSLMSPRVSMCIDFCMIVAPKCLFIYFFLSLVGSSFMCQFSWFY